MLIKIKKPKVLISYAWGSKEYQEKVLSFATDLSEVGGIDVILDKWSLKEGHDTNVFMEKCVTDSSITNVLILLDEQYKEKADSRSGGVGIETQIISTEVYNKVEQEKFIPIVFERGKNGEIYKPIYLKNSLHFDLSLSESFDQEFQRLVKRLYGVEIYQKPEIGKMPLWVDSPTLVSTKIMTKYNTLKSNLPGEKIEEQFNLFLGQMKNKIMNFKKNDDVSEKLGRDYISIYADTHFIRDEFLHLLKQISYVRNTERYIADKLEDIFNSIKLEDDNLQSIKLTLLHEIFIYVIANYLKNKNYKELEYIFGKTYFKNNLNVIVNSNFSMFYYNNDSMDKSMKNRDNKNYFSGTAAYWIENLNTEFCSKNEFVFADMICFNYSVFGNDYHDKWLWFPITYVYSGFNNKMMSIFSSKLMSLEQLSNALILFGYNNLEKFKSKFIEIEERQKNGEFKEVRYRDSFDRAELLCNFIKSDKLGTLK